MKQIIRLAAGECKGSNRLGYPPPFTFSGSMRPPLPGTRVHLFQERASLVDRNRSLNRRPGCKFNEGPLPEPLPELDARRGDRLDACRCAIRIRTEPCRARHTAAHARQADDFEYFDRNPMGRPEPAHQGYVIASSFAGPGSECQAQERSSFKRYNSRASRAASPSSSSKRATRRSRSS